MKQLIMPTPADPPALHRWREHALGRMQHIFVLGALPVLALDLLRLFRLHAYGLILAELLACLVILGSGLIARIPYQWRTFVALSTTLIVSSYLLFTTGLISAGRVYVVSCTFIAGLMLSRRSLFLVWLSGAAALLLSGVSFLGRAPAEIALLAQHLSDPSTLLTNGLITLVMSAVAAFGAASLVGSLARSLRLAEQVIAERDQTNAELEQRVATRTQELAQALSALQASEAKYKTLFQSLPVGVLVVDDQGRYAEYNPIARDLLGLEDEGRTIERAAELSRRLIRLDGSSLPLSEYPSVRMLYKREPINDLEVGVVRSQQPSEQLIWLSMNVVPLDLPNYSSVVVFNDISARTRVEQTLARQLAVQEAVATCSQILLQPALTASEQKVQLGNALSALCGALHANQLNLIQNFTDPQEGFCARILTGVTNEGTPYDLSRPLFQRLPWRYIPTDFVELMQADKLWAGPLTRLLEPNTWLTQIMQDLAVHSILCIPIFIERSWWGLLIFADTQADRIWEPHELQLIQMAAGMFGTAIQRWQTEAELSLQLRYAEALARCSQALLQPAESEAEHQRTLVAALTTLREAVNASRVHIFQPPSVWATSTGLRILADSQAPDMIAVVEPSFEQISDVPHAIIDALEAGRWFGGPVHGCFPDNPRFQQVLDQNGVQAILMVPVMIGGAVWGVLSVVDRTLMRDWDAPTIQLLRTASEMIATFQQSWETTQSLRAREHFIQRVTEATPDMIHVLDRKTQRSLFVNRSPAAQFGYPPETMAKITFEVMEQVIHPDDYPQVLAFYDDLMLANDGRVAEQTFRVRTGDGGERWLLSRDLIFARDEAGRPSQILSIIQDITTSKQTEQALAASETRLRALRDALPDLLFVVRADGTFLEFYAPRQAEILVPAPLFLGRNLTDVLPPEIAEQAQRAIAQVRESGGLELFEDTLTFDQRDLMFEIRVVSILSDEFLFVVRDITERRRTTRELLRAKEAAEAADRAKSTFLAHISHEIRTPLTAIIGMASLLGETDLSLRQSEYATTLRTGAETLLTIIGNILDFSKIEASQMELTLQPFDLRACLKEACDLVAHQARLKGLALEWAVDAAVPTLVSGDRVRLRQVLVNLLGNAVKFTERGSITLVSSGHLVDPPEYELLIVIRDTGIGIAADRLTDIFDPFVQLDSATTRRYSGTGLGLAISRQLVGLMGGQITVSSTLGVGTTFTLSLPLRAVTTPLPSIHSRPSVQHTLAQQPLRLLLAEDNPVNQEVLRRLLESLGYMPDVVSNGVEALDAVRQRAYDVVLMDIQMPELDGEAATRGIRALEGVAQPMIVALTASALRGDRERYLAAGMDAYLSKPVQREDLRTLLAQAATPTSVSGSFVLVSQELASEHNLVNEQMLSQLLTSIGGTQADAAAVVIELFRDTLATQLVDLGVAVAAADRDKVRLLAHKMRGGSRQLGVVRLAEQLTILEAAAQHAGEPLESLFDAVRQTYDQTLAWFMERLGEGGG